MYKGGFIMDELIGQKVKVTLNSVSGFITIIGKVIRSLDQFVLVDTTLGPLYIGYSSIKMIQVLGDHHEEK
jgi:RNase P/RNase MRP subunit p29